MAPMGPLFQVIMRSLSKPVSNSIVSLASNHPKLRKYLFIPVGQALIRLTIRLRMQNLGFGKPNTVAEVTEAAAIQEAADVASFSLFVALSLGIYQMARWLTPELAKKSDFDTAVAELQEKITELQIRLDKAEVVANASNVIAPNRIANQPINAARKTDDVKKEKVVRSEPILSKITALPIDEATRITLSGSPFIFGQTMPRLECK